MDENFLQIIVWIVIIAIWALFGGNKKKKTAPKPKPAQKTQPEITDGQPSLADLLNKMKSTQKEEKEKGPEYYSSEIHGDPYKSSEIYGDPYQSKKTSSYNRKDKDQHLKGYRNKKKNLYIKDLLDDKDSLRKAFIMSEIFKPKF